MTCADLLAAGSVVLAVASLVAIGLNHGPVADMLISLSIVAGAAAGLAAP